MTDYFVRSTTGNNANDGLSWATAKQTIAGVVSLLAAGDTVFVSQNHSITVAVSASVTYTFPGSSGLTTRILVVDDTGDPPNPSTLATGAFEGYTSGTGGSVTILSSQNLLVYGLHWRCERSTGGATLAFNFQTSVAMTFVNCILAMQGTNGTQNLSLGTGNTGWHRIRLINTTLRGSMASWGLIYSGHVTMEGGGIVAGTAPTTLLRNVGSVAVKPVAEFYGCDFSLLGASSTFFQGQWGGYGPVLVSGCKFGAGATLIGGSLAGRPTYPALRAVQCLVGSDLVDAAYFYSGTDSVDTTIYKSGRSEGRKLSTNANASELFAVCSPWVELHNAATGSPLTVDVLTLTDGVTLTDLDAWIEVEYPDGFVGRPAVLSGTAYISDSSTWVGSGSLASPVKQKLSATFTPARAGSIRVRLAAAIANTDIYADLLGNLSLTDQSLWTGDRVAASAGGGSGTIVQSSFGGGFRRSN